MGFITLNVPTDDPRFGKAFECPDCHGGPEVQRIRDQQRAGLLKHLQDAGLTTTDRHDWLTWDHFTPERMGDVYAGKEIAVEYARLWAEGRMLSYSSLGEHHPFAGRYPTTLPFEPTRGLWLMGDFGTGKTGLARVAMRDYLHQSGKVGLFVEWSALYEAIKAQYNRSDGGEVYPLLQAAATVPVLLLDDIGQKRQSKPAGDDEYKKLWFIIDHRYRHRTLETIITSNLNRHELADQFDAKIAGRLAEMCVMVEMSGMSLREYDRIGR